MWKETFLQVLIVFLPLFWFMVWYTKPEKDGYTPAFIGFVSGLSMLLCIQFTNTTEYGIRLDLRDIPLILGSLYGGIPVAIMLMLLYVTICLSEMSHQWEYAFMVIYLLLLVPMMYASIPRFQDAKKRKNKFIIIMIISLLPIIHLFSKYLFSFPELVWKESYIYILGGFLHVILFLILVVGSVHLIEMIFERVRYQYQLGVVSNQYLNEVRRLQQFIDTAPLIVLFCDNNGIITHVNNLTVELLHPKESADIIDQDFIQTMEQLGVQFDKNPIVHVKEHSDRWTEIIKWNNRLIFTLVCPIIDKPAGTIEGILVIGHDITEIQRLRDEVGKMERLSLVGQMAASITHEIRNPMAVIRGFIQLLNERGQADQQSYFRIVLDELDRANTIINDFLSLAQNRIVPKQLGLLDDILNELHPLLMADANMRGQSIEYKLCENMEMLEMNSKEIKQLILNLARNGMEAMDDQGVLCVETYNFKDTIQLRITDKGVGISHERLENLFEPFYTTKSSGTGLGLSLCLSIVERHKGKIHVESVVGEGTTFIVSFCKPGHYYW